jgi:hypothetical protein
MKTANDTRPGETFARCCLNEPVSKTPLEELLSPEFLPVVRGNAVRCPITTDIGQADGQVGFYCNETARRPMDARCLIRSGGRSRAARLTRAINISRVNSFRAMLIATPLLLLCCAQRFLSNGHEALPVATACIRALESPHSAGNPCSLVVREWHHACVNTTEQGSAGLISKPTFTSGEGAFASDGTRERS